MTTDTTTPSLPTVAFPSRPSFAYFRKPIQLVAREGHRVFINVNIRVKRMDTRAGGNVVT
jgi:hypothetical protein